MIQRLIPRIGFGWSMRVLFFIEIAMLTISCPGRQSLAEVACEW
jgi:hypothetical protein